MQKNLTLASYNSYARLFKQGQKIYERRTKAFLSKFFDMLDIEYRENIRYGKFVADFVVNKKPIFCDKTEKEREEILRLKKDAIFVYEPKFSGLKEDTIEISDSSVENLATIFLDEPSFSFDYAHILPATKKCSVMHGHTSSVLVEISGKPINGMVIDFGDAKDIIRNVIKEIDHKLFINRKYVLQDNDENVRLAFKTVHGVFDITAPKKTTVLIDGEATTENLAKYIVTKIAEKMPANINYVGVYVYEGMNKGAYILSRLHSGG